MILLVLQEDAPKAVLNIFTERTELTVTAKRTMETEVASIAIRAMDTLIRPFTLKAMREIATIFMAIRFDTEETILEREGIMAPVAVFTFS